MIKELFYDFFGYNERLFFQINKILSGDILQTILSNISDLFYYYNFIIYFLISVIYCIKKINEDASLQEYYFNSLMRSAVIYCCFVIIFALLKHTVNLPRPLCSFSQDSFYSIVDIGTIRCLSSFPSAHSGFALLLAYFALYYFSLDLLQKCVVLSLVIVTGLARIGMAMHFPADVLYGYLISIFVIIIGDYVYQNLPISIKNIFRKMFVSYTNINSSHD